MEKKQPRIAFRYEKELLSFYNRSVKKYFTTMIFVFFLMNISVAFRDWKEFIRQWPYVFLAFMILLLFYIFLWRNTKRLTKEYLWFTKGQNPLKGKIIDFMPVKDKKGKVHYICKVKYKPKGSQEENIIETPYVTGNPFYLLRSLQVDVYEKEGQTYVTGFQVAQSLSETPANKKRMVK